MLNEYFKYNIHENLQLTNKQNFTIVARVTSVE